MNFKDFETGDSVSKDDFEAQLPQLRVDLVNSQYELQQADFSVVILIGGDDRIAANELINSLNEWMDARYIGMHVFAEPTQDERERPRFWRYWRELPAAGQIGMFVGAWAMNPIAEQVFGKKDKASFKRRLQHIRLFEQTLVDEGTLLLKFWLHLPEKLHRKRAEAARDGDEHYWKFDDRDWKVYKILDKALPLGEQLIEATNTTSCPWQIIDTSNKRYRDLTVARSLLAAINTRLEESPKAAPVNGSPTAATPDCLSGPLDAVDLSAKLEPDDYKKKLRKYQIELNERVLEAVDKGKSSVLVFEGWDAAGKGGTIRRLTQAMHVRDYRIVPIAAPTDEERARHYLWRFWRQMPRDGRVLIFDRSWYGRVLVERVEGFATTEAWQRAYDEINDFEALMVEHGINVQKFWLHLHPDEQLRRFKEREKTAYKKYKITEEDYRNRERWDDYVCAVNDMVERTSTKKAPWHLISSNDKRWARVEVLKHFCKSLK